MDPTGNGQRMENSETSSGKASLRIENVGGISETRVDLAPGLTVLEGRNATNRTSMLQAIIGAVGGDQVSLKASEDRGEVTLELDGETYTRTLERVDGTVRLGGEPFLEDGEVADLFAFLFESNDVRRAVRQDGDLRDLVMRPVDTEAIRAEIRRVEDRKRDVEERLSAIEDDADRLPSLEQRRAEKRTELESKRERLSELEPVSAGEPDDEGEELEARLTELNERRSELSTVRRRIESQEDSLASLEEERHELRGKLADEDPVEEDRLERLDRQLSNLRQRKSALESTVSRLDRIVAFNEDVLDGEAPDGVVPEPGSDAGGDPDDGSAITDKLLEDEETVACWTCGSEVRRSAIEATLEELRRLRQDAVEERRTVARRIDELGDTRSEIEDRRSRLSRLEERLERVESEISERREELETARAREDVLESAVADMEDDVEELRRQEDEDAVDRQREATRLEMEIERLEAEQSDLEAEIGAVEDRLEERDRLEAKRQELQQELDDLRTKIDRLESDAVESFNEHMANLLSALEYDNLERIWIERTFPESTPGSGNGDREFVLHVVRSTDDGTVYEDTVDHLSESEREVLGLVVALAGYLAHDVHERVPFMLLDSLEAIDSERIATLLEYFEDYAEFLVVALLPEDAEAVDGNQFVRQE